MEKIKNFINTHTPYLEDIRRRIYSSAILFICFFVAGFLSAGPIIKFILSLFNIENVVVATTSPFQFANLSVDIGLSVAFLALCPVLAYHMFIFLRPALSKGEKRRVIPVIAVSCFLFSVGFVYGFFVLYYALIALARINIGIGVQNIWDIGTFLSQIILTASLLGALFQFPILCTYLVRTNLIPLDVFKKKRRVAVFIIFCFATLLPPTDGVSLIAMVLPLVLLYEITILVNYKAGRGQNKYERVSFVGQL